MNVFERIGVIFYSSDQTQEEKTHTISIKGTIKKEIRIDIFYIKEKQMFTLQQIKPKGVNAGCFFEYIVFVLLSSFL
jgi:hypothetical protein